MALYLYKHKASPQEVSKYGGDKVGPLYNQSIEQIKTVIDKGYRPYASQQKLIGFHSNRGMFLLNRYRIGAIEKPDQVLENYNLDVQQLLADFPNNYSFMNTVGVFLLNKADAQQSFSLLDDEQATREEAISLLKKPVETMGYNSSAGRRLDLVQIRLIKNQVLQNKIQRAFELALDLYQRNPNFSNGDAQSTAIQCALLLAHGNFPENERVEIRQRLSRQLVRTTLNKYWITPAEREFFSAHKLISGYMDIEQLQPIWVPSFDQ